MMAQKTRCVEGCAEHMRRRTAVALWVAQLGVKARNVKLHKAVRRTSALSEKVRFWVNDGCMGTSVVGPLAPYDPTSPVLIASSGSCHESTMQGHDAWRRLG